MKVVGADHVSAAEIEKKVIEDAAEETTEEQQEEQQEETTTKEETSEEQVTPTEINDDVVLSYIGKKLNKDVTSFDDLMREQTVAEELDVDVAAFNKYKKDTGRGIEDFVKLNRDLDTVDGSKLLSDFYKENGDDDDDVAYRLKKFRYDEDEHTEEEIEDRKIALKQELKRAKKFFEEQKEKYNVPLESRKPLFSEAEKEDFEAYKVNKVTAEQEHERQVERSNYFTSETDKLYSDKFEGFKFKVDEDSTIVYKPSDVKALKENSSLKAFVGKYLNDDGFLNNAEEFHKALTIASDPEKFAKFFIEQGRAMAVSNFEKESKNVDMKLRTTSSTNPKPGLTMRVIQ